MIFKPIAECSIWYAFYLPEPSSGYLAEKDNFKTSLLTLHFNDF